jgi:hypothetical protein
MQVDRALGDARAARDIIEPRRRKSLGRELVERRGEDRFPPGRALFRASAATLGWLAGDLRPGPDFERLGHVRTRRAPTSCND